MSFEEEEEEPQPQAAAINLDDKIVIDKDTFKEWFGKLLSLDETIRDRLLIIQLAAENGWKLARAVAQRKSGKNLDEDIQYV